MNQTRNVLNVQNLGDNNRIKQGDKSIIRYALIDANKSPIEIIGKNAVIRFLKDDCIEYEYRTEVITENEVAVVDLTITEMLKPEIYTLEIIVDDKYIFPSDNSAVIEVTKSSLAQVYNVLSKPDTVESIKTDVEQSLIDKVNQYTMQLVEQKLTDDKAETNTLIDTKIAQIHIPKAKNYDDVVNDLKSEQGTIKQSVQDFIQLLENAKTENANALQNAKAENTNALQNAKAENTEMVNQLRNDFETYKNEPKADSEAVVQNTSDIKTMQGTLDQVKQQAQTNIEAMQADVERAKQSADTNKQSIDSLKTKVDEVATNASDVKIDSDEFVNAVSNEAERLITLDKYKSIGQIGLFTIELYNGEKVLFVYSNKWLVDFSEIILRQGQDAQFYLDSTISGMQMRIKNDLDTYGYVFGKKYSIDNYYTDWKKFIAWVQNHNALSIPTPFSFRITRKLNGVVVATKDCNDNSDLTFEDAELYTKVEAGATLEVEYLYKGQTILDEYKCVKDLSKDENPGGGVNNPLINPNILEGTKDFTDPFDDVNTIEKDGVTYAQLINGGNPISYINVSLNLEPNTQYTFSLDTFSDGTSRFDVAISDKRPVTRTTLIAKQKVQRKSFVFNTTESTDYRFTINAQTGKEPQTYVAHLKLEQGNKATPYSE